ncbi:MAG: S8 family serine peptidase [Dehalococcoidales bacterium]|nr:MAG: S8 family serine peptidase [Dehalococcoidales bacterium]
MDYRSIKITLIFLLIITSSIAFLIGSCSGFSSYTLITIDDNSNSLLSNLSSYQVDSYTTSHLEYQDVNTNEYAILAQNVSDIADEVDNTIEHIPQYPILTSQDFLEQHSLDHDGQVIVAILDTGIDADHEALYPVVASEINFTDSPAGVLDKYGHGTPIAGIIAANPDSDSGVQGVVSNCRLLNVKVVNDRGHYDMSDLVDGILWAVDNGANVINISIVSGEKSTELEKAINYAWQNGVIVVAAAGNGGSDAPVYPAAYEHCIAVTAVDDSGDLIPLANYGDWVDIAAPGYKIYSTLPGNDYGYTYGTSFATAYVSGLAARLYPLIQDSNNDGKSNDEVCRLLLNDFPGDPILLMRN